jgi:hypothetical protein
MGQHKYSVGQNVRFTPDRNTDVSARGAYTIVRTLPESGGILQYRVKAKMDGQERVVREDQLDRSPLWERIRSNEIFPLAAGGFGVEISIQDTSPATVSRFDTEAAALRANAASRPIRGSGWLFEGPSPQPPDKGGAIMRKPNDRFERAERDRTRRAKKEERVGRHQERASHQTFEQAESVPPAASDKPTMI